MIHRQKKNANINEPKVVQTTTHEDKFFLSTYIISLKRFRNANSLHKDKSTNINFINTAYNVFSHIFFFVRGFQRLTKSLIYNKIKNQQISN